MAVSIAGSCIDEIDTKIDCHIQCGKGIAVRLPTPLTTDRPAPKADF
jgi:hypothetical protein